MMHSVEARPPFLDHQLWEFVAQLAPALKLASGHNKRILRKVAQDVLPAEVVNRPKKGLATPHAAWLRSTKLPSWAEEALHPASLTASGFFNPKVVARLREEHTQYKQDHSRILMGILTTQLWEQLFL